MVSRTTPIIGGIFAGRLNSQSEEELNKKRLLIIDTIGMGDSKETNFNEKAFDKLVETRRTDFNGFFKKPTDPKAKDQLSQQDELIKTKLDKPSETNAANAKIVKIAIGTALSQKKEFTKAQTDYKESVANFKELVKGIGKPPKDYNIGAVIGLMTEFRGGAVTAIKKQHSDEKNNLTIELNKPNVTEALKKCLDLDGTPDAEAQVKKAKERIIADLEKGHKKQLESFENTTKESLKVLHNNSYEQAFIQRLREQNSDMAAVIAQKHKEKLDAMSPEERSAIQTLELAHGSNNDDGLGLVKIQDLDQITTVTGKTFSKQPDGSYRMEMGINLNPFNAKYILDPRDNVTVDMISMAQAVRASGHDQIKMSVNFDPESTAKERGKQAFEACIKAGFAPEKITISVNGTEYGNKIKNEKGVEANTIQSELFKMDPHKYQKLKDESKTIAETIKQFKTSEEQSLKKTSPEMQAAAKKALTELREKNKPPQQIAPNNPAANAPHNP